MTRKTAKEYSDEYIETQNKLIRLETETVERLFELIKQYPDIIVHNSTLANSQRTDKNPLNDEIKTGDITSKGLIEVLMDITERIDMIGEIEKWLADQEKYKQGKLF